MKTITWNEFLELINDPANTVEVDGFEAEIYEDVGCVRIEYRHDDLLYSGEFAERNNKEISIMDDTKAMLNPENQNQPGFIFQFFTKQPIKLT
jgi:hypothetical protein